MCDGQSYIILLALMATFIRHGELNTTDTQAAPVEPTEPTEPLKPISAVPLMNDFSFFTHVFSNFARDRQLFCGSALVDQRWVITASTCLTAEPDDIGVYFKTSDRRKINPTVAGLGVSANRVLRHLGLDDNSTGIKDQFNLALLELPYHGGSPDQYASLPNLSYASNLFYTRQTINIVTGGVCSVVLDTHDNETTLKAMTADISMTSCNEQANYFVPSPYRMCLIIPSDTHKRVCSDDPGSPVIIESTSNGSTTHTISAVVSSLHEGCTNLSSVGPCVIQLTYLAPHIPMILYLIDQTTEWHGLRAKMDEWMANPMIMSRFFS